MDLSNKKKILVVRLSSLGDILLTTPMIRSIKNQYPHISIDMLLRDEYKETVLHNPYLSSLLLLERRKLSEKEIIHKIKSNNYDAVIDLQNNIRTAYLLRNLKTPIITFNKKRLQKFLLVRFKINLMNSNSPIPVRYAESIKNFQLDDNGLDLFIPDTVEPEIKGENIIAFCPGARHLTKRWLPEYFIELGNLLIKNLYRVVLIGGRSDIDICKSIADEIPGSENYCKEDGLLQIAANMKKCKAVVCNDSGLMHAACAVNIPVITIYGSTVKEFGFTPYKNINVILENNSLNCRPCSHIGKSSCPKKHFRCMKDLSPEYVYQSILKLISPL